MIVKSLVLENIRSYKNEEIIFEEGISLLSGDIGSGKSSVLQAVEFALLGFKRGDLEGIQILRKGSSEGSVKLILIDTKINSQVEIYRRLKKAKNSDAITQENGYMKFDDELVEMSPQELNSQVFELLNFPKEFITKDKNLLYRFTIYTAQEQLKEILYAEPEKRLELLRKIFQIDKYKQVKQAISLYLSNMKIKKKELEVKLENESKLKEEIKELEIQLKDITLNEKKIKSQEKEIKEKLITCNSTLKKIEGVKEKYDEMILKLEKALSNLENYLEQKKNLIEEIKNLQKEKKELGSLDIVLRKKELGENKKKFSEKLKSIDIKQKKIKEDLVKINQSKKELEVLRKEIKSYEIKKESVLQMKKSFDYVLTKCRLKDSQVEIKKIKNKLNGLEKKKINLDKNLIQFKELEIKINLSNNNLEELDSRIKNFKSLDQCPHCFTEITKLNEKNILMHLTKDRVKLEKEVEISKSKFKDIVIKQNNLQKELKDFDNLSNHLIQLEEKERLLSEQEKKEKPRYDSQKILQKELEQFNLEEVIQKEKKLNLILESEEKLNHDFDEASSLAKELEKNNSDIDLELEKLKNIQKNFEQNSNEIKIREKKLELIENQLIKKKDFEEKLLVLNKKVQELNSKKIKWESHKEKLSSEEKNCINLIATSSTRKAERESYLKKYDTQLKELKLIKTNYNKLIEMETFLGTKAYSIVDILERKLFTSFYLEFNEAFEYYFKQLIEDNEIEVRLDEEFTPLVEQNGHDVSINTLSGGEKSSLAIAYKLGLKKIIEHNIQTDSGLHMLILDEPTDGFSTEQIDRLGLLLKESDVEQTLLVSHDEKLESIAQNILRVEKVNHTSIVSNS